MIVNKNIDNGRAFDFGKTSQSYAKYRDIYPEDFYKKLLILNICTKGQSVLDLGTGTGVLPRAMYKYGARFTATDISQNQIEQAKRLACDADMNIEFICSPAEELNFENESFDVVTACQCFTYFNHKILAKKLCDMLKNNGRLAVIYMAWLPFEDKIAGESERLILKYNPNWTGCRETRRHIPIDSEYFKYFTLENKLLFDIQVPFTRESWHGRVKTCRGIEASLSPAEVSAFEKEHNQTLEKTAPESFNILHYAAIAVLKKK